MGKAPDFSLKAVRVSPEDVTLAYVAPHSKRPTRYGDRIFYQYVIIQPGCDLMFFVGEPEAAPYYRADLMQSGLVEITERLRDSCRVYLHGNLSSDEKGYSITVTEYAGL